MFVAAAAAVVTMLLVVALVWFVDWLDYEDQRVTDEEEWIN